MPGTADVAEHDKTWQPMARTDATRIGLAGLAWAARRRETGRGRAGQGTAGETRPRYDGETRRAMATQAWRGPLVPVRQDERPRGAAGMAHNTAGKTSRDGTGPGWTGHGRHGGGRWTRRRKGRWPSPAGVTRHRYSRLGGTALGLAPQARRLRHGHGTARRGTGIAGKA